MAGQSPELTPERTLLVLGHMAVVERTARAMSRTIESEFQIDELTCCGFIGLVEAARAYNPEKGPFQPYATMRIRGAITDGVRRLSHMTRRQRQECYSNIRKDWDTFEDRTNEAQVMLTRTGGGGSATESMLGGEGAGVLDPNTGVETQVQRRERIRHFAAAIDELSATTEREILGMRFIEQRSFETIAERLSMSRSALSKRHSAAVESVAETMRNKDNGSAKR